MFTTLIQIVSIVAVLAFAGGLVAALLAALRSSSDNAPIRRAQSALFKVATGSFVLVIFMTLLDFMVRAMNDTP